VKRRFEMEFAVGEKVQVRSTSVWPERIGCYGTIVAPPADGTYPQPGPGEVLVRLEYDPLGRTDHPEWSCVYDARSLQLVSSIVGGKDRSNR
jgi:hypothetical protein